MVVDDLGIILRKIFNQNFKRKPEESILFLTDVVTEDQKISLSPRKSEIIEQRAQFTELLSIRTKDLYGSDKVHFLTYPSTLQHGKEPPSFIIDVISNHDIFIALTSYSLTHTESIKSAVKNGTRGASMPGILPDTFKIGSPLDADIDKIRSLGDQYIRKINSVKLASPDQQITIKITDTQDNVLIFNILNKERQFHKNYGQYYSTGAFGNLPAGEIYISPDVDGKASGKIAIPKNWCKYCANDASFMGIYFKDGKIVNLEGAKPILLEYLGFKSGSKSPKSFEDKMSRRNFALFGIGLNPYATRTRSILEASKALGTIHIGIGRSTTIGGEIQSDFHLGFVIPGVSIDINQEPLMIHGVSVFNVND